MPTKDAPPPDDPSRRPRTRGLLVIAAITSATVSPACNLLLPINPIPCSYVDGGPPGCSPWPDSADDAGDDGGE
jgi:hypothetical protein